MELVLNGKSLHIEILKHEVVNHKHKISMTFPVKSEEYHDVTTLLYEGSFHVEVPEKNLIFPGKIEEYATSITNLYNENQVGTFFLVLMEV